MSCLFFRILSDWLEVKLGGDGGSEERPDGTLQTLCVTNALQEKERRTRKVHITVKVRSNGLHCHMRSWEMENRILFQKNCQVTVKEV